MPRLPSFVTLAVGLLLLGRFSSSTAQDDFDPAFQRTETPGPLALVPENYLRVEWETRYAEDVTR